MSTNRVLCYLNHGCDCQRRRQRQQHLESIAEKLDGLTGDLFRCEADDDVVHISIISGWTIDDPENATAELAELLTELIQNITEDLERIGGAV